MPEESGQDSSDGTPTRTEHDLGYVQRHGGVVGAALATAAVMVVLVGVLVGPVALVEVYGGLNGIGLAIMLGIGIARARRSRDHD